MTIPTATTLLPWLQPMAVMYLRCCDQPEMDDRYLSTTAEVLQLVRAYALEVPDSISDEPRRIAHQLIRRFDLESWSQCLRAGPEQGRDQLWDELQNAAHALATFGLRSLIRSEDDRSWVGEVMIAGGLKFRERMPLPFNAPPFVESATLAYSIRVALASEAWEDVPGNIHLLGALSARGDPDAVNALVYLYQTTAGEKPAKDHPLRPVLAAELEWVPHRRAVIALMGEAQRHTAHWSHYLWSRVGLDGALETILATERAERAQWRFEQRGSSDSG